MKQKGLLLVLGTAVISGFSIFINKYGVSVINPYIFTFLKNVLVAVAVSGLILGLKDWRLLKKLTRKQWGLLLVIGLAGGSLPFLLFFKGLSLTNAAESSFIQKTMFVYVALLASVFLKEKLNKNFLIGGLFLMAGNLFLLGKSSLLVLNKGTLLIFVATLFWAMENVISKYALKELPGKVVGWGRMFFGSLFILVFLSVTGRLSLITNLSFKEINWIIITAVILLGYVLTWYNGLKHVPVSQAAAILTLGAPITTLLNLISGNAIGPREILAGVFIVFGVILVLGLKEISGLTKKVFCLTRDA
ncbi:MAG: DMT family transporter [Candidatus Paceibacterota bacterium]